MALRGSLNIDTIHTLEILRDAQKQAGKKNLVSRKNGMTPFRLSYYETLKTQDASVSSLWEPLNTAPMTSASCYPWLFAVPSCTVQVGLCDQYNMAEVIVCDYTHTPYAFLLHDFPYSCLSLFWGGNMYPSSLLIFQSPFKMPKTLYQTLPLTAISPPR